MLSFQWYEILSFLFLIGLGFGIWFAIYSRDQKISRLEWQRQQLEQQVRMLESRAPQQSDDPVLAL